MNEQMMILMIFQFRLGKKFFDKKKYQQKLYNYFFFIISYYWGTRAPQIQHGIKPGLVS